MNHSQTGYLLATLAVILWSLNFIVSRYSVDYISPISLSFWRWVLATLIITPFFIHRMPELWLLFKRYWLYLLMTALFGVTTFNTFLYIAAQTTEAVNLSLIAITYPIFTILLLRFTHHELIKKRQIFGIILVVFGVITLIMRGQYYRLLALDFVAGDLWMLSAAFLFALYSIFVKNKPDSIDSGAFLYLVFFSGSLMMLPIFMLDSEHSYIYEHDMTIVAAILYVAIGPSIICYLCWIRAIALIGPANTSLIYYTLPIFSSIAAYIYLGEQLGAWHILSAILIISGILLANYRKRSRKIV